MRVDTMTYRTAASMLMPIEEARNNMGIKVGSTYEAHLTQERGYSSGNTAPYPSWYGNSTPVRILGEYDDYFLVEVLEHRNPNTLFGNSRPYNVTIDKWSIRTGMFILKEKEGLE